MNQRSRTSVILVNYNGGQTIVGCLSALREQALEHQTIVIDNASTDESLRAIASHFPETQLFPLRRNVGFARAANIGALRSASADTLVLLNPDTVPRPDFLEQITAPLNLDSRIAAVAGTLVFTSSPTIVASAGIDVHRNGVAIDASLGARLHELDGLRPVFGASGGAVAYRAAAFASVGGFCEPFFMYLEDVDLAWRLRLHGWDTVTTPLAVAAHDYSASSGEGSALKRRLLARNRIWTLARCLPSPLWARDRCSILGFDAMALGYATARRDWPSARGRTSALVGLPARLAERTRIQSAASVEWESLDGWLKPALSPIRLVQLRRLTARYAARRAD